jgi:hypothetical protein
MTEREREVVGASWLLRMEQEHLAVGAFAQLTAELAALGCQPAILELAARAVADEVRHAQLCRQAAIAHLGAERVPAFLRGAREPPAYAADREQALVLLATEMCCISETLTGAFFTEMLERTSTAEARALVRALLTDEIDHGRIGWALLEDRRKRGMDLAFVAAALPALLAHQCADVIVPTSITDEPALEAHGYLGPAACAYVYRTALADIVLPGFDELGIDTSAARHHAAERGWDLIPSSA